MKSFTYAGPISTFMCEKCLITFFDHKPISWCPVCGCLDRNTNKSRHCKDLAILETEKRMERHMKYNRRQFD